MQPGDSGSPLTSGAAGKQYLQDAAELAPGPWGFLFYELLPGVLHALNDRKRYPFHQRPDMIC